MHLPARAALTVPTSLLLACLTAACTHASSPRDGAGCDVTEANLVGAWRHASDAGFFEEFELSREDGEQVFRSWLHQRPAAGGDWSFDSAACRLHITATDMRWDYHVALQGDALHLRETPGENARYLRIAD